MLCRVLSRLFFCVQTTVSVWLRLAGGKIRTSTICSVIFLRLLPLALLRSCFMSLSCHVLPISICLRTKNPPPYIMYPGELLICKTCQALNIPLPSHTQIVLINKMFVFLTKHTYMWIIHFHMLERSPLYYSIHCYTVINKLKWINFQIYIKWFNILRVDKIFFFCIRVDSPNIFNTIGTSLSLQTVLMVHSKCKFMPL